jgi:hypothetical protein
MALISSLIAFVLVMRLDESKILRVIPDQGRRA